MSAMSEVPLFDASLGGDLNGPLCEDELMRYFEDFEQSPFDSKVPSDLLDVPLPLPTATTTPINPIPKIQTTPVIVKREVLPITTTIATSRLSTAKPQTTAITPCPPAIPTRITPTPVTTPIPTKLPSAVPTPVPKTIIPTTAPVVAKVPQPAAAKVSVVPATPSPQPSPIMSPSGSPSISPNSSPSGSLAIPAGLSGGVGLGGDGDDKSVKRQRRLLKNRESAQLSRIRKKMYIEELEKKVNALTSENTGLREEVVKLNDVLKQNPNTDTDEITKHTRNNVMMARRTAGVCLLVVLFSLGLFFNATPRANENRLVELDNLPYRDYGLKDAEPAPRRKKEKIDSDDESEQTYDESLAQFSERKRSWSDDDEDDLVLSSKRAKTEHITNDYTETIMDTELKRVEPEEEDDEGLFDVLADDAFSDDGILTTSPPPTPPTPTSTLVPSTPTFSTPPLTPSPEAPTQQQQFGIAVVVPSYPLENASVSQTTGEYGSPVVLQGYSVVNVHVWPVLRTAL